MLDPGNLDNKNSRYLYGFRPLAFAVSTNEYTQALALAPFGLPQKVQFFLLCV